MSKGNKKKRGKGKGGAAATSWEALGAAMLATLGNTLGQLIADGAEHVMSQRAGTRSASNGASPPPPVPPSAPAESGDVTTRLLRELDTAGEHSIADLVSAGGASLTATLEALRSAREFGLVEFDEGVGTVTLTEAGRRTVAALCGKNEAPVDREEEENAEAQSE